MGTLTYAVRLQCAFTVPPFFVSPSVRVSAKSGHAGGPCPRYTLDELLAQCDGTAKLTAEDSTWVDDKPLGDELI